ncbi:MAG TPA: LamG-like jellyroll fold domain-containing protein [Thermoanaerobaculia bacterium]|nr:LamG-like jellyroll fold domain-containing protein [Thermoanaerobaculia bacterium]
MDGPFGSARRFNGAGDGIAVAAQPNLKMDSGGITIGAWLKPERLDDYVFGYAGVNANWGIYSMFLTGGRPAYGFYGGGLLQYYVCNAVLPLNRTTQVTFSYTFGLGSSMRCYVNGIDVGGAWVWGNGGSPPQITGTLGFEIGHWAGTPTGTDAYWFQGAIDEPFVLGHALNAAEVSSVVGHACR